MSRIFDPSGSSSPKRRPNSHLYSQSFLLIMKFVLKRRGSLSSRPILKTKERKESTSTTRVFCIDTFFPFLFRQLCFLWHKNVVALQNTILTILKNRSITSNILMGLRRYTVFNIYISITTSIDGSFIIDSIEKSKDSKNSVSMAYSNTNKSDKF